MSSVLLESGASVPSMFLESGACVKCAPGVWCLCA